MCLQWQELLEIKQSQYHQDCLAHLGKTHLLLVVVLLEKVPFFTPLK
jgi:hypothetical protein